MVKPTVSISVKDLDMFKELFQMLLTVMSDERISEDVREEYMIEAKKVLDIKSPTEAVFNESVQGNV